MAIAGLAMGIVTLVFLIILFIVLGPILYQMFVAIQEMKNQLW